jgi:hypothetical protein
MEESDDSLDNWIENCLEPWMEQTSEHPLERWIEHVSERSSDPPSELSEEYQAELEEALSAEHSAEHSAEQAEEHSAEHSEGHPSPVNQPLENSGRWWQEDVICCALRNEDSLVQLQSGLGLSFEDIVHVLALKTGQTPAKIRQVLAMKTQGLSTKQIGRDLGIKCRVLKMSLPEVSKELSAKLSELRAQGKTDSAICRELVIDRRGLAKHFEDYDDTRMQFVENRMANVTREEPRFIYSLQYQSDLYRTNINTGQVVKVRCMKLVFSNYFSWTELPRGNLLITYCVMSLEVYNIDTTREFVVTYRANTQNLRGNHNSLYYDNTCMS